MEYVGKEVLAPSDLLLRPIVAWAEAASTSVEIAVKA
jgi:hypothetical protein